MDFSCFLSFITVCLVSYGIEILADNFDVLTSAVNSMHNSVDKCGYQHCRSDQYCLYSEDGPMCWTYKKEGESCDRAELCSPELACERHNYIYGKCVVGWKPMFLAASGVTAKSTNVSSKSSKTSSKSTTSSSKSTKAPSTPTSSPKKGRTPSETTESRGGTTDSENTDVTPGSVGAISTMEVELFDTETT